MRKKFISACKFHGTGENHARDLRDAQVCVPHRTERITRGVESFCAHGPRRTKVRLRTWHAIGSGAHRKIAEDVHGPRAIRFTDLRANHECDRKNSRAVVADDPWQWRCSGG